MDREQYWHLHLAFITAVCERVGSGLEDPSFRRHVVVHLPLIDAILAATNLIDPKGICWMWDAIARVLWQEGRWKESEELVLKMVETTARVLGQEHPDTLDATAKLAATYGPQRRWKEAEMLSLEVVEVSSRVLGEEHPATLAATADLAAAYSSQGRSKEAEGLLVKMVKAMARVSGEEHPNTLYANLC
jgi:hypothetical protein